MDLKTAFAQINNLDVPGQRRRSAPSWATVAVDRAGQILDVIRHKEEPTPELHRRHMDLYPESVQFTTRPGLYATPEELEAKVRDSVWAHESY